jgi:hypothetical protein
MVVIGSQVINIVIHPSETDRPEGERGYLLTTYPHSVIRHFARQYHVDRTTML